MVGREIVCTTIGQKKSIAIQIILAVYSVHRVQRGYCINFSWVTDGCEYLMWPPGNKLSSLQKQYILWIAKSFISPAVTYIFTNLTDYRRWMDLKPWGHCPRDKQISSSKPFDIADSHTGWAASSLSYTWSSVAALIWYTLCQTELLI